MKPKVESIFCPRCGNSIKLEEVRDVSSLEIFKKQGYDAGRRGKCGCGVVALFLTQPLPKSPTFTLMFNIYQT